MADERMHSGCRWSRLLARLKGERGFALIEVVVSAGLVMVIAAAVLGGIDIPSRISGDNQSSSQAAALAQADQERLRGLPISQLIGYSQAPKTPTVDGRTYTVTSKVGWVTDGGSTVSCASSDTTSGDYLKLTSTVTGGGTKRPVVIESLLAPPNGSLASTKGNLAALVTDELDQPEPGVTVSIPGKSGVTDANGCVFFGLITPGNYTVTFSKAGWVDPAGISSPTQTKTVSIGNTTLVQQQYAQAASITANVSAPKYGVMGPSPARTVTLANAGLSGGLKLATAAGTSNTVTINNLFPFKDGYTLYAGACVGNNPAPNGGPFVGKPAPGGSATVPVTQGSANVQVTMPSGFSVSNPTVNFYNNGTGCADFKDIPILANGKITEPSMPSGTYDVCADGTVTGYGTYHVDVTPAKVINNFTAGTPVAIDASNPAGAQSGPCP